MLGTAAVVGIQGTEQEIEEQFNSFWNHGATSGELTWDFPDFAHFCTTPKKLDKYFLNSSFHKLLNEREAEFKGKKGGVMQAARELAAQRKAAMETRQIISTRETTTEPTRFMLGNLNRLEEQDLTWTHALVAINLPQSSSVKKIL